MYKIKLIFPYPNYPIARQVPNWLPNWGNFFPVKWGDFQFFINDNTTDYDFLIVFNFLINEEICNCPIENRIFLTAEPSVIQKYSTEFLSQFGHVITCQRDLNHKNKVYFHQGHNWFVGKNYDELINNLLIEKTKPLSIVVSNKQFTDGHKKRFDFVMSLKDHFKSDLDLFGRGINDFEDKWDVLAPYKYSIAIENYVCDDWITEKIYDCYLAHTFPIYYGCPNIEKYFDSNSYELIDIENTNKSIKIIENILSQNNFYEEHLEEIIKAKLHYLNNLNIFPLVCNYIIEKKLSKTHLKTPIRIHPEVVYNKNSKTTFFKIKNKIKNAIKF
ncbi:glycosyltransferase family 10 domain-containing protein [Flavobacterium aquidurense]|uniref:Putative transferase n=1 Tax=Flavobacterium aquidurense TaxID=362413 RepID=A0A0Q0W4L0_9FLAO|nr:glycosyltransferase family 10 [Flavobacterium aquidurense]KQB41559.1 putative transferase [Flavobacterium aquidurense]